LQAAGSCASVIGGFGFGGGTLQPTSYRQQSGPSELNTNLHLPVAFRTLL